MNLSEINQEEVDRQKAFDALLKNALKQLEWLPLLTPDEFVHLGILRIFHGKDTTELKQGCTRLIEEFCAWVNEGSDKLADEEEYLKELLYLASDLKIPAVTKMTKELADQYLRTRTSAISTAIWHRIFGLLVVTEPYQSVEFWKEVWESNPELYACTALTGILKKDLLTAVEMLPKMPNQVRYGHAVTIKFKLASNRLAEDQRREFVDKIKTILPECGTEFSVPVQNWIARIYSTPSVSSPSPCRNLPHAPMQG